MKLFVDRVKKKHYTALCAKHSVFPYELDHVGGDESIAAFQRVWLQNPFLANFSGVMWEVHRLAARHRFALRRAVIGHLRRKKVSKNDFDLVDGSSVDEIPAGRRFNLYEKGCKYSFSLMSAVKLILSAVTNNIEMISAPVAPLNPYTRRPISIYTVYRLYVALKLSFMTTPPLFYGFVQSGGDLARFVIKNECALREHNAIAFVHNMPPEEVVTEVRHMFAEIRAFNRGSSIMPNWDLMPPAVLQKFKPWLYLYEVYCYTLNPYMRAAIYSRLVKTIFLFLAENPTFGQKKNHIVVTEFKSGVKREYL